MNPKQFMLIYFYCSDDSQQVVENYIVDWIINQTENKLQPKTVLIL